MTTTVMLSIVPDELPATITMKATPRSRKLGGELTYDPTLNPDGTTGKEARWWLVVNESHRVGAMYADQVRMLITGWLDEGWVVRAEVEL